MIAANHVVVTCDYPGGCEAKISAPTSPQAITAARDAGWVCPSVVFDNDPHDLCPDHKETP